MQLTIGNLTKQTSIYGFFQLLQKAAAFLVIPVYTHYLTPSEFGTLDILYLIVWFVGIVGGSKLDTAFVRYYAAASAENKLAKLLSSSVFALIVIATGICVIAAYASRNIVLSIFSNTEPLGGFYLALIATWLQIVGSLPSAYLRARHEARLVGLISLAQTIGGTGVGLLCITLLDFGYQGILIGLVVSGMILTVYGYWVLFRRAPVEWDLTYVPALFKYALPMLPAPLFMYLLNYADRYFLLNYRGLAEVGIYAMAYKFAMLLIFGITGPFESMWAASQFALYEAGQKETYQKLALIYISTLYTAAIGIVYFSFDITLFAFDSAYHGLVPLVAPLTVGIAIWGIVPTLDFGCQITNKTWIRSYATGLSALLNVALNWILISNFGMMGAAIATLFSFVFLTIVTHLFNRKLSDYSLNTDIAIRLTVVMVLFASLIYLAPYLSGFSFITLRVCALITFALIALKLNGLRLVDLIETINRWLETRKKASPKPAA